MRARTIIATLSLVSLLLLACEEDRMFTSCSFDPVTLVSCQLESALTCTNYTCAVAEHPDCVDLTCLAYEGAEARCTRACDPEEDDCPSDSICTTYSLVDGKAQHACVKVEDQEKLLFQDCSQDNTVCAGIGADACLPLPSYGDVCSRSCDNPCGSGAQCLEYNEAFFCLKPCDQGAAACAADERCIEYRDTAYCMSLCDTSDQEDCGSMGNIFYDLPSASTSCNPHAGCPGRAFCASWNDSGHYCLPCEFAAGRY